MSVANIVICACLLYEFKLGTKPRDTGFCNNTEFYTDCVNNSAE